MTTELPEPDDDFDRKLLADFARVGWAVVGIPADDEGPSYAFSIGLHRAHSHPEVILIGLPFEASQQFINAVGATVSKGGRYEADHRYDDLIEGHVATFVSVDRSHYKAYLGAAGWFYRGWDFPVIQMVWPDRSGSFPWDARADARFKRCQPLLGSVRAEPGGPFGGGAR